jgi:hypothetical protein
MNLLISYEVNIMNNLVYCSNNATVKGMTSLRNLHLYVDSLIGTNHRDTLDGWELNVNDLHTSDAEEFAGHLILDDCRKKAGWDWLLDDAFNGELAATFAEYMLAYGSKQEELKDAFLEGLKQTAIKVLKDRMQTMIDDQIGTVEAEDDYERRHPCDADDWDYQEGARL